jgi:hypothetical protein
MIKNMKANIDLSLEVRVYTIFKRYGNFFHLKNKLLVAYEKLAVFCYLDRMKSVII